MPRRTPTHTQLAIGQAVEPPDTRRHDDAGDGPVMALAEEWDREPWMPEGLTFRVGDRVRIRLSAECGKLFREVDANDVPISDDLLEHAWDCDGDEGFIDRIDREPFLGMDPMGHFYIVRCVHGFETYAACELVPLSTAADEAGAGGAEAGAPGAGEGE